MSVAMSTDDASKSRISTSCGGDDNDDFDHLVGLESTDTTTTTTTTLVNLLGADDDEQTAQFQKVAVGTACMVLMTACWGIAAPTFKVVDVHPLVRLSWRAQTSLIAAFPVAAAAEVGRRRQKRTPLIKLLATRRAVGAVVFTGTTLWLQFVTFNLCLSGPFATAFVHMCVFTQLHPQIIAAALGACSLLPGKAHMRPSRGEATGVLLGLVGAVTAAYFDRHTERGDVTPPSVVGDLLAVSSAACSSLYALGLKTGFEPREEWPSMLVQFLVTIVVLVETLVFAPMLFPGGVRWTTSDSRGMLDWPTSEYMFPYLLIIGATTIYGHTFMTAAMARLPVLVCSLVICLIPVLHEVIGFYVYHVAGPPHAEAVGGWVFVFAGLVIAGLYPSKHDPFKPPPSSTTRSGGIAKNTSELELERFAAVANTADEEEDSRLLA